MSMKLTLAGAASALLVLSAWGSPFSEAQAKIKEKYPEEYEKIQAIAATDMAEAQKKLAELARKGNIRLPRESGWGQRSRFSGPRGGERGERGERGGRGGMDFRGGRAGGMGGAMGMMRRFNPLRRFVAESQIKSKFAAEYAQAEKELLAAADKIDELAKKAKVTLPVSSELQMRRLRAKAPEDFAKLEEQSESDPRAVFGGLRELAEKNGVTLSENPGQPREGRGFRGGERGGERGERGERGGDRPPRAPGRENPAQTIRKLRQKYPEEMKAIMALREEDPKEFSRRLQELNRRYAAESGQEKSEKK